MKNKIPITFLAGFCTFLLLQCQEKKVIPDVTKAELKITDCGIFYKNKSINLNDPIEKWEEVLGKYTRSPSKPTAITNFYIWDNLGIGLNIYKKTLYPNENNEFYLFFTNLESEEGKQGKLEFASGRRSYEDIEKEYHSINKSISKELEKDIKEAIQPAKNFVYPYTIFSGVVDLQGAPLQRGMPLKEINQYREKQGLSVISFRDDNMNGWDESGTLTGDYGNYFTIGRKICPDGNAYLFIVRFTDYKPEYIKVILQEEHEREYHYDKNGNEYK